MLENTNIQAGSDEFIVKTYHASKFRSKNSGMSSDGYLHVTNQRVIFQAIANDSVIHSEIPIDNVSGINLYHGVYNDWVRALIFGLIIGAILLLGSAGGVFNSLSRGYGDNSGVNLIGWGIGLLTLAISVASNKKISAAINFDSRSNPAISMSLSLQGIVSAISLAFFIAIFPSSPFAGIFVLGTAFLIFTLGRDAQRRYSMSLAIISKGGSSAPIMLAGTNPNGMVFSNAAQALEAEPGNDATQLIQELGAIIHDIQTLGTLGVERWMNKTK